MKFHKLIIFLILSLYILLICIACSGSDNSDTGVIRIDTPTPVITEPEAISETIDIVETKTDEEITTEFTTCLREHGFSTADPTLNADGSIDLESLRDSILQDPVFDINSESTVRVFEDCLPLLEDATFATTPSQEDQIELQDNLLEFAQCIRDNGIDVPDPEFSGDPRQAMQSMFEDVISTPKLEEAVSSCIGIIFGADPNGRRSQ